MKHNTIKVGRSNVRIAVGRFPTRSDFVVDAMVGPRKVAIRSWMDNEILRFATSEDAERFVASPHMDSVVSTLAGQ